MKIGFKYNTFNRIRDVFRRKHPELLNAEIKSRWAANQIQPLQDTFTSTKEMFSYARERCVADLVGETPKEHTLILDLKHNKVLAEYIGNSQSCTMKNLSSLAIDSKSTAVFHGHPDFMPISCQDVNFLLNNDINQVVAINIDGEFSIIEKTENNSTKRQIKKAYKKFRNENLAISEDYYEIPILRGGYYKQEKHRLLSQNAHDMGLRYVTNYKIFKQ